MSNLIPLRSMLHTLNRWPDVWDEDNSQFFTTAHNGIDVYETADEVSVKANVAGVKPEEVDVTFEKGVLWIQAKVIKEEADEESKYYNKSSWNYSYKVAVPGMIDHAQEPEVTLNNGVLKVIFKKAEASKPKKLTVKSK